MTKFKQFQRQFRPNAIFLIAVSFIISSAAQAADVYSGADATCGSPPFINVCFLNDVGMTYANPAGTNLIPYPANHLFTEFVNQGSIQNYGYIGSADALI